MMKYLIFKILLSIFKFIFYPFIFLPVTNKITLISRMSDNKTLDIKLLERNLKLKYYDYKIVVLSDYFGKKISKKIKYLLKMPKYVFYIYTSKIVICDCYIPAISLLKKKKSVTVIQVWHASGAYKKFGYSSLNTYEGYESKYAKILNMHKNYDYVVATSDYSKTKFSEAFNINQDKIIISHLPRYEYLLENKEKFRDEIINRFGLNNNKINILYAPTFRKSKRNYFKNVIDAINYDKYNLIIKKHGGIESIYINKKKVYEGTKNYDLKLLCVSDIVITDYSAITFDALSLNKKVLFYVPDYDKYLNERDIYEKITNGLYYKDINTLFKNIDSYKNIDIKKYLNLESYPIEFYIDKILKGETIYEKL